MEKREEARVRAGRRPGKGHQVRGRGSNCRGRGLEMRAGAIIAGLSEQTHRLQLLLGCFGQLGQVQAVEDRNGEEERGQT